jgi:hypothetical protein
MTIKTISETAVYKQTLLGIIEKLPVEHVRQIVDYARAVQTQAVNEFSLRDEKPARKKRRPHPDIAGKGRTLGDLVSPMVDDIDWVCLQ